MASFMYKFSQGGIRQNICKIVSVTELSGYTDLTKDECNDISSKMTKSCKGIDNCLDAPNWSEDENV